MADGQQEQQQRSIRELQEEVVEEFEFLGDWTERYRHIIELGRDLPPYPEEKRTDAHKVEGCQAQVWLHAEGKDGRVHYFADSDAHIVRGLIALLLESYNGHTADEILATPPAFIDRLGLAENLSQNRAQGMYAVLEQMKRYALALKSAQ